MLDVSPLSRLFLERAVLPWPSDGLLPSPPLVNYSGAKVLVGLGASWPRRPIHPCPIPMFLLIPLGWYKSREPDLPELLTILAFTWTC
jgi:hypothetical protein